MADLRDALMPGSDAQQFVGLGQGCGQRLLDQDVNPSFHQGAGDFQVQNGGHGDRGRLHFAVRRQHLLDRAERFAVELARYSIGPRSIGVDHAHEAHAARIL